MNTFPDYCDDDMFEIMILTYDLPFSYKKFINVCVFLENKYRKKYKLIEKENHKILELTCSNSQCNWGLRIEYDHDGQIIGKPNIRIKCAFHQENEDLTKYEGIIDLYNFDKYQLQLMKQVKKLFKRKHELDIQRQMEIDEEEDEDEDEQQMEIDEEEDDEEDDEEDEEHVSFVVEDTNIFQKQNENHQQMEKD